jgi:hypothetical protein
MSHPDEAAHRHGGPWFDQFYRFFRRHDLVFQRAPPPEFLEDQLLHTKSRSVKIITNFVVSLHQHLYCNIHANRVAAGIASSDGKIKKSVDAKMHRPLLVYFLSVGIYNMASFSL